MVLKFTRLSFILILFLGNSTFAQRIAIVGAMPEEIRLLLDRLEKPKQVKHGGVLFYLGKLKGKEVVILKSGIGKVNASYTSTVLFEKFKISHVIFTGVAGGLHPDSYPGDLVISEAVFHHDYARELENNYEVRATRNLENTQNNPLFFKSDSLLLGLAKKATRKISFSDVNNRNPKVFVGNIATGDSFISNHAKAKWLYENFDALAVEMEGAALAQICFIKNVPFLIIRSCSDNANNQAHLDFQSFVKPAAENAIKLVLGIFEEF
jgi:adenosylhomocysteine nucleosidase